MNAADPKTPLPLPLEPIAELCRRHGVERLDVFGSILRDDYTPESDIDFLVVFRDNGPDLTGFQDMQDELEKLLGRKIDLVSRKAVERSSNYLIRRHVLSTARPIYDVQG